MKSPRSARGLAARLAAPELLLSSKPTQTAASSSGVKPTNQASRWPLVVPVFPPPARRSLPAIARVRRALVDHAAHERHHHVGDLGLQRRRSCAAGCASSPIARIDTGWPTMPPLAKVA
jgi:hypothetical protein